MKNNNMSKQWGVVGGVMVAALSAQAQARDVDFYVQAGVDFGGDEMVQVFFEDGETDEIKAGELLYFSGGLIVQTAPGMNENLETQLTVGWKFDSVDGDNGEVSFDRFPLELLQFIRNGQWRFGGGLAYHMNPKLEGDGFFDDLDVEFDDALGGVVQVDYSTSDNFLLGGRMTFIDYDIEDVESDSVDANSFGLFVGGRF